MNYEKKWWRHSVYGVALVGLGINLVAEATIIKAGGPETFDLAHAALWFWIGLFGLAAINAGICFVADAVKQRIYLEMEKGETPTHTKKKTIPA
ncbi:MAG: hypothetical protein EA360_10245 [Balneolaceae bacterium]|nr:MAG: hypothetical protein EA360_10245 [Balneolaceae bacterium]